MMEEVNTLLTLVASRLESGPSNAARTRQRCSRDLPHTRDACAQALTEAQRPTPGIRVQRRPRDDPY